MCRPKVVPPIGDPYKYSDYLLTKHSKPLQQILPIPSNNIISDRYFDNANDDDGGNNNYDNCNKNQSDFEFEDLIPIIEDNEDEYNLDAVFHHFEANTGY